MSGTTVTADWQFGVPTAVLAVFVGTLVLFGVLRSALRPAAHLSLHAQVYQRRFRKGLWALTRWHPLPPLQTSRIHRLTLDFLPALFDLSLGEIAVSTSHAAKAWGHVQGSPREANYPPPPPSSSTRQRPGITPPPPPSPSPSQRCTKSPAADLAANLRQPIRCVRLVKQKRRSAKSPPTGRKEAKTARAEPRRCAGRYHDPDLCRNMCGLAPAALFPDAPAPRSRAPCGALHGGEAGAWRWDARTRRPVYGLADCQLPRPTPGAFRALLAGRRLVLVGDCIARYPPHPPPPKGGGDQR